MNVKCKRWEWALRPFIALSLALLVALAAGCSDSTSKNDEEIEGGVDNSKPSNPSEGEETDDSSTDISNEDLVEESFYGIYEDEETGLVYEINEDGTYKISQQGILLESGSFDETDESTYVSRAQRPSTRKKTITQRPKVSAGAKKSTAKPAPTKVPISKTSSSSSGTKTYIGNTSVSKKTNGSSSSSSGSSSSSSGSSTSIKKTKDISIYVRSQKIPVIYYLENGDIYNSGLKPAYLKNVGASRNGWRWYVATVKKVQSLNYHIFINGIAYADKYNVTQTLYFDTSAQDHNGVSTRPSNYYRAAAVDDDEEESYNGRNNLYYVRGSFETETDDGTWKARDGWNNMTEINENIFKCTLYLPQNIYGFQIATVNNEYGFCVPFDHEGFVPKNEWFDVVQGTFSNWQGKNIPLATGGGLYTFFLDITDEANPQMLISTDEMDGSAIDDAALYVVGAFNDWKFDESAVMYETSQGSRIWEATVNISSNYTEYEPCEFKIADKTWGGIVDDFGYRWWLGMPSFEEGQPTSIDGAYLYCRYPNEPTGSTLNLSYPFTAGKWTVSLDITTSVPYLTITRQ